MTEKYYTLGTHTSEQWIELHAELIADGNVYDTVPSREVAVDGNKAHSSTRGDYLLTDEEARELKSDSRVKFINLSMSRHPEIWEIDEEELMDGINGNLRARWSDPSHHWHYAIGGSPSTQFISAEPDINRNSSQFLRMQQRRNPWIANRNITILNERNEIVEQRGAGENVDVIVADNGCWIGHTEFINTGVFGAVNPDDYIGGNVLPGNGICDVLDLVLDSPYYIDPDWFNANAATRLMTRWDGTTVPTETAARSWWQDSSQRSEEFAVFGNIPVSNNYTRNRAHGSNSVFPSNGTHGTQCGSQTYGRTHGWAYNSNKWHLNLYGTGNTGWETSFDIEKIFHQYKPINPVFNTKDPTIVSNSWSFKRHKVGTHYYFNGSGPVAYTYDEETETGEPDFLRRSTGGSANTFNRFKSEMKENSMTQAAEECLESGVIWFVSGGNNYQNIVNPDHPSYDNRIANNDTVSLYDDNFVGSYSNLGWEYTGTTNRRGFPQQAGKTESQTFQGNTTVKFPCISVGALDDQFTGFTSGSERKVEYSDHGSAIDFFCVADGTIAATTNNYGTDVERVDNSYTGLTARNDARDTRFSGTSSACPIATGFFATVIQYNRNWTYEDIRNYVNTYIENQLTTDFHVGNTEPTTANGSGWFDRTAIFTAPRKVLYQPETSVITTPNPLASADQTPPVITINGSTTVTHERFTPYNDAGATADGGETVTTTGTVDVNTVGTYLIGYYATDAAGNTGSATRTVNVVDTTGPTIDTSNVITTINEGDRVLGYVTSNELDVTWSVYGTSQADISISSFQNIAAINLKTPADFELQPSYSFVVSATDAYNNVSTVTLDIDVTNDPSDDAVATPFPTSVGLPVANSKFGFSDTFNRADGRLDSSVNWEEVTDGANHVMIDDEELEQDGVGSVLAYVNSSRYNFNDDQQASIVIEHYDNGNDDDDYVGPAVRVNPSGACYTLFLTREAGVSEGSPLYYNDGSDPNLINGWSQITLSDLSWLDVTENNGWNTGYYSSNKITLRVIGSELSILLNDVVKATATDNRLTSGQPGIGMGNFTSAVKVSDFSAFSQPLNVFTDDFNRSDSGLSVSNNWSVWGDQDYQPIISTVSTRDNDDFAFVNNKLVGGSHSYSAIARVNPSAQAFGDDQEASIYLTDMLSTKNYFAVQNNPDNIGTINALGVAVRVNNTGEGYVAVVDPIRGDLGGLYRTYDSGIPEILYDDFIEPDSGHWSTYRGGGNNWNYTDGPEKLTLRVEGDILTVLVNDQIVEVVDVTEILSSNKLLTRGQPGVYHEGFGHNSNGPITQYDLAIDNFHASAFVEDSGPIGTQFFIRSIGRTGGNSPSDEDENAIALARDLLANTYTSPGEDGDPPSIEVTDPYYASGRYDYSANDDYYTDFKDAIRDGNGENFYLSELEFPPAIALKPGSYNQYHVDLMLYPTGQIDELDGGWSPSAPGHNRTVTADILDPNGNVITSRMNLGSTINQLFVMPSHGAYDISFTVNLSGITDYVTQRTKYDDFKLPAQPITALMNDFSQQTFNAIYDVQQNDNLQCIVSYPTTLNYVILELELKIPWYKASTQEHVDKYYRFRQRLYDHPDQVEANIQSINTPGTGDPNNLPELPGGDD